MCKNCSTRACCQNLYQDSTPCLITNISTSPPASPPKSQPGLDTKISTRTPHPASPPKSLPRLLPLPHHYQDSSLHCHQNLYQDSTPCLATKISTQNLPGLHPLPHHQNIYQDSTPCLAIKISTRTLPLLKGGVHQSILSCVGSEHFPRCTQSSITCLTFSFLFQICRSEKYTQDPGSLAQQKLLYSRKTPPNDLFDKLLPNNWRRPSTSSTPSLVCFSKVYRARIV